VITIAIEACLQDGRHTTLALQHHQPLPDKLTCYFVCLFCYFAGAGRPADIEQLPDGSMVVSDDMSGAIFRITWQGGRN
jgi:hypothetical protein